MRHRATTGRIAWGRHSLPAGQRKKLLGRGAGAFAAVLALVVMPFLTAPGAQAVTHTFVIDSLDATATAKDIKVGDGVCATAAGTCTMQAALQETNALNLPAGAALITVQGGLTGNINPLLASRMDATAVSDFDGGAHFLVTAPVTIDLKNQVTMETLLDSAPAMFHANGPDIHFLNMNNVLSGETSFVMGPKADGVIIDGGTSVTQRSYGPERFVIYREGAKNITVRNYRLQGFYPGQALFYFNQRAATPVENVVIDSVQGVTRSEVRVTPWTDQAAAPTLLASISAERMRISKGSRLRTPSYRTSLQTRCSPSQLGPRPPTAPPSQT